MRHSVARYTQIALDLSGLAAALWVAVLLRFEGHVPLVMFKRALFLTPYIIALQYGVLAALGVPRFAWRYVGLREVTRIFAALCVAGGLLLAMRLGAGAFFTPSNAQYAMLPIGVIGIDLVVSFMAVSGLRVVRRLVGERQDAGGRVLPERELVRTMLVGAGQGGLLVAKEITTRRDLGIEAVGFVDDDQTKVGTVLHGIPVLGTTAELGALCHKHGAREVLITFAKPPGKAIRRLKALCDDAGLSAKIIPGVYEIVGGQVNLSRIRNVTIEDLLGRDPVTLELAAISASMRDRTIVVTGAGGSIGSEICRQVCLFQPSKLLLVERAENNLFQIHRELLAAHPPLANHVVPCVADITDAVRMDALFREHKPDVIFHAAAHKHVPMMEWNPGEAVKNNVFGTRLLADLAHSHGVRQFVMISTDKAVNPTSVMGCSKRIAEIYVQALARHSQTRFSTVRFGNVLGSAGSVIPIFQEQIARGGPVTITHPEMKRYFMTIPEACQLVLQAGTMGEGGEIFILDMGEPVKIVDLARDLIRLSGFRPDEDIELQFVGIRPGEKLFEELSMTAEGAERTRHPKIYIGRFQPFDLQDILARLSHLRHIADVGTPEQIRSIFHEIVPEYAPVVPTAQSAGGVAEGSAKNALLERDVAIAPERAGSLMHNLPLLPQEVPPGS
jgi:FlaA1/EpsC-like NDP-sugar epimerase